MKPELNAKAQEWMNDSNIPMILDTYNLDWLERQFVDYRNATYVNRKRSDAKSIEIYGYTNPERYNYLKKKILDPIEDYNKGEIVNSDTTNSDVTKKDVHDMGIANDVTDTDPATITESANSKAREWSVGSNIPIVYNTRNLDRLEKYYNDFLSAGHDNKRRSNDASIAIYGMNNIDRYNKMKDMILHKQDMIGDEYDDEFDEIKSDSPVSELCYRLNYEDISDTERANILLKLSYLEQSTESYVDKIYLNRVIDESLSYRYEKDNKKMSTLPFFSPSEMIDLGVFSNNNMYSNNPDNTEVADGFTTRQWFDVYQDIFNGAIAENRMAFDWMTKVRELYRDYDQIKESGDIEKINARKQSILELGWNPEIEFTQENMVLADNRINALLEFKQARIKHVDLTQIDDANDPDMNAEERKDISPIYVILSRGKKWYSDVISKVTKSEYSHASVGTDHTMNNNYSYLTGGFKKEDLKSYGDDRITVFTFFVNNKYAQKFKEKLEDFKQHASDSIYDLSKMFDYVVNNTKERADEYAQVCSTFVNKILTSAGIPLEKPKRGIATPEDINRSMNKNAIYKIFDGKATEYDADKAGKKIKKLLSSNSVKVLKEESFILNEANLILDYLNESNSIDQIHYLWEHRDILNDKSKTIVETYLSQYTEVAVMEISDLPIQFNDDGDLLIYKIKKSDFDYHKELKDSIKLMKLYESQDNYDGMKYELAKLWYMNQTIESKLEKSSNKKLVDARSNILNAFYTYCEKVMKYEKDWNFVTYYESTPYSKEGVKINKSTLINTGKLLKGILTLK